MRNKIIVSVIMVLLLVGMASATDYSLPNINGIGTTTNTAYDFVITNNNASNGYIANADLGDSGFYNLQYIIANCNNCLYGAFNPYDNTLWGTDEQGNVFYTDAVYVDYSLGFYSYPSNSNPLYKVGTFTGVTYPIKIAFDSSGNAYASDGQVIKKFVESLDYTPSTFYTITNTLCVQTSGVCRVLGISIDSSNNLHALVGGVPSGGQNTYVRHLLIDSAGNLDQNDLLHTHSETVGITHGGLVLDSSNASTNYTYAYHRGDTGVSYLKHNSSAGSTDISGTSLTGIASIGDIAYLDYKIYVSSYTDNLIRSYVTTYEGYSASIIPDNPDSITGVFQWVNGYRVSVSSITPGMALAYSFSVDDTQTNYSNYDYYVGWYPTTGANPDQLMDITNLYGLGSPAVFNTPSNDLAGTSIYGYLLSQDKTTGAWYQIYAPLGLTISGATLGVDSITLNKAFYNVTSDTVTATFTYKDGLPWFYQWQICTRADCSDFTTSPASLAGGVTSSSMVVSSLPSGTYYAVMMKHLPMLQNTIVAQQVFEIRAPIVGVSWDKSSYNLLPRTSVSSCMDSTPNQSYFSYIDGYAGLKAGYFSCATIPASANANNSIMRASLYSRYNSTFYLNNSLGSIWSETLDNGSATLLYVLTNTSTTEKWTLSGYNNTDGTMTTDTAEVNPEDHFGYSISISPNPAYNLDTLYLTFTRPIFRFDDVVVLKDADGQTLAEWKPNDRSGTYYIDPSKQYAYGTWTAYWVFGNGAPLEDHIGTLDTVEVRNSGRPITNASTLPPEQLPGGKAGYDVANLLSNMMFWAFMFTFGAMGAMAVLSSKNGGDPVLPSVITGFFGLATFTILGWVPTWVIASIILLLIVVFAWQQAKNINTGGS